MVGNRRPAITVPTSWPLLLSTGTRATTWSTPPSWATPAQAPSESVREPSSANARPSIRGSAGEASVRPAASVTISSSTPVVVRSDSTGDASLAGRGSLERMLRSSGLAAEYSATASIRLCCPLEKMFRVCSSEMAVTATSTIASRLSWKISSCRVRPRRVRVGDGDCTCPPAGHGGLRWPLGIIPHNGPRMKIGHKLHNVLYDHKLWAASGPCASWSRSATMPAINRRGLQ